MDPAVAEGRSESEDAETVIIPSPMDVGKVNHHAQNRVLKVDPNGGRCIITNAVEHVECFHYFPRKLSQKDNMMTALEWHWNLKHKTLNLDTRGNIICTSRSMRQHFEAHKWLLIPTDDVLETYHKSLDYVHGVPRAERSKFPRLPRNQVYEYHFVPVTATTPILRRNKASAENAEPSVDDCTVHLHPYKNIPLLKSHIHPKFVILESGRKLGLVDELPDVPAIKIISDIYAAWTRGPPADLPDNFYEPPPDEEEEYDDSASQRTRRHRIRPSKKLDPTSPSEKSRKGRKPSGRTRKGKEEPSALSTLVEKEKKTEKKGSSKSWDSSSISSWTQSCEPIPQDIHQPWENPPEKKRRHRRRVHTDLPQDGSASKQILP